MNYTLREIEERVYALLDENKEILEERMELGDPCTSVRSLIEMLVEESAVEAVEQAPLNAIDECEHYPPIPSLPGLNRLPPLTGTLTEMMCTVKRNDRTGKTRIQLPDDFCRLIFFRMSDWDDGVSVPLKFGGEECQLRMGARQGYRSRRHRPAVAIDRRGDKKYLEIFGSEPGATVSEMDYLVTPRLRNGSIDIAPALFGDVCRRIANKVIKVLELKDDETTTEYYTG